jgi:hypothetical protein
MQRTKRLVCTYTVPVVLMCLAACGTSPSRSTEKAGVSLPARVKAAVVSLSQHGQSDALFVCYEDWLGKRPLTVRETVLPQILAVVWSDGTMLVRTREENRFGYRQLSVPRKEVDRFRAAVSQQIAAYGDGADESFVVLDQGFRGIWAQGSHGGMLMESVHEVVEENSNLVALSYGVRVLEVGKTREDAIAADTKEYQRFREVWQHLRLLSGELVAHGRARSGDGKRSEETDQVQE